MDGVDPILPVTSSLESARMNSAITKHKENTAVVNQPRRHLFIGLKVR